MTYRERPTVVPGVVLWRRQARPGPSRILPDGCMDLIWNGSGLLVAGPDTRARWHVSSPTSVYVGLRFCRGIGPGLLGLAADEIRDRSLDLNELWPSRPARILEDQVTADPAAALERWLAETVVDRPPPSLGAAVFDLAAGGTPVAVMAERLGYSVRQLHRRCQPLFGYGPQHLTRVLHFGRAIAAARPGRPLAEVAAETGFTDQAHLSRDVRQLAGATPARLFAEVAG